MEQMDLLVRGLAHSAEPEFMEGLKDTQGYFQEVEGFLPRLVSQSQKELLRCSLSDIITLMETFFKLWNKQVF